MNDHFRRLAGHVSAATGSAWAFTVAVLVVIVWVVTGPLFDFADTWQLVINTGTTIVTFLMVFLIQNTQNRDARAIHLKLDELIHATKEARNRLIEAEEMSDEQLQAQSEEFTRLAQGDGGAATTRGQMKYAGSGIHNNDRAGHHVPDAP